MMEEEGFDMKRKAGYIDHSGDEEKDEERVVKKVLISVPSFEVVLEKKPDTAKKTGTGRPRGRPRKDAAVKPSPEAESAIEFATGFSPSNTPEELQPAPTKKRGRPPRVKSSASTPLQDTSTVSNPSPRENKTLLVTQPTLKRLAAIPRFILPAKVGEGIQATYGRITPFVF
jgi:hypothetical protein